MLLTKLWCLTVCKTEQCYKNQKEFHIERTVFDSDLLKEILKNVFCNQTRYRLNKSVVYIQEVVYKLVIILNNGQLKVYYIQLLRKTLRHLPVLECN